MIWSKQLCINAISSVASLRAATISKSSLLSSFGCAFKMLSAANIMGELMAQWAFLGEASAGMGYATDFAMESLLEPVQCTDFILKLRLSNNKQLFITKNASTLMIVIIKLKYSILEELGLNFLNWPILLFSIHLWMKKCGRLRGHGFALLVCLLKRLNA